MADHSATCLHLMQLFPRVIRGMRRWQDRSTPSAPAPLGPRHVAALEQVRGGPVTVGALAGALGLTLPTVSGVLADLDRAGLIERRPDPQDRRRTIVEITPDKTTLIEQWLDGAARPLSRVLDKLTPAEQDAFLKAMDLLEAELRVQGLRGRWREAAPDESPRTTPTGSPSPLQALISALQTSLLLMSDISGGLATNSFAKLKRAR